MKTMTGSSRVHNAVGSVLTAVRAEEALLGWARQMNTAERMEVRSSLGYQRDPRAQSLWEDAIDRAAEGD